MTQKEYLGQYREDIPAWLREFQPGESHPIAEFLKSRIVFYPGSEIDGHPVEVFGASHSAHCFIYADYWLSEERLKSELREHGFWGYDILDEIAFPENEIMEVVRWNRHFLSPDELQEAAKGTAQMREYNHPAPYALLVILERQAKLGDDHGPERLAILFLGADGIATYEAIFANRNAQEPFGMLLHDHGFGGNYNCFGNGGFLDKIIKRSGVSPKFILAATQNVTDIYDGYESIYGLNQPDWRCRCLFLRHDAAAGRRL